MKLKIPPKLAKLGFISLWVILVAGFIGKSLDALMNLQRSGDEGFFLKELARFQEQGLWDAFSQGISHLHVLLVSILASIFDNPLFAGRLLSLLLLPLSLFIGKKIIDELGLHDDVRRIAYVSLAYILVFCQTGKMFYRMLSDPVMVVMAMLSMLLLQRFASKGQMKYLLMAAATAGMTLWARSFAVMILGGFIAYLFWRVVLSPKKGKTMLHLLLFVSLSFGTAMLVQIPSLATYRRVSFENKSGDGNWSHRNWITRIYRQSNGGFFSYERVSWEQVDEYTAEHGTVGIPVSISDRLKKDPKFTVDNIVSNFFVRIMFVLAISTGLFFLLVLDMLRKPGWMFRRSKLEPHLMFIMVAASVSFGLSIYIINYIEHRWLFIVVFSALMLGAIQLNRLQHKKWFDLAVLAQFGFILLMSSVEILQSLLMWR